LLLELFSKDYAPLEKGIIVLSDTLMPGRDAFELSRDVQVALERGTKNLAELRAGLC
jgi:hypothetical protein